MESYQMKIKLWSSKLWSGMDKLPELDCAILAVSDDDRYRYYEKVEARDFDELINEGYIMWCYVYDLVQAAYDM